MDAQFTGNQISTRRKELGLTQKDLAEKLHVTDKAVSKWERGLNFPDLGLMENLADALDTTPAYLLGLEEASRDEIVSSVTEISNEQLEDTLKDIKWLGWGALAVAAMLTISYLLFGGSVERTQRAYLILHCMIIAVVIGGLYLLIKYGQIRKFEVMDLAFLYTAGIAIGVILFIQFVTGYSPNAILALCMIAIAACNVQLLFLRIMEPPLAKALPLILTAGFAAWHTWRGNLLVTFITPAVCCFVTWLAWMIKNRKKEPIQ